jgi:hypothetical protein
MSSEENKQELMQIKTNGKGVMLSTIDDMYRFANCVRLSNLAPKSFKTTEQIVIAIQSGAEVDLTPMQSLKSFCVINGVAHLYGDAPLALVLRDGNMEWKKEWMEGEGDERIAYCEVKRKGEPEPVKRWFAVEDAKIAHLWQKQGPWQEYPRRMLQLKARSWAIRDVFPDSLCGATIAEDYIDVDMPEPAHEVTTPRRAHRAEDVTITDTPNPLEELDEFIKKLVDEIAESVNYQINPDEDKDLLLKIIDTFAKEALEDDETDFTKPENFTPDNIARCLNHLGLIGLTNDVLTLVRDPLEVEDK